MASLAGLAIPVFPSGRMHWLSLQAHHPCRPHPHASAVLLLWLLLATHRCLPPLLLRLPAVAGMAAPACSSSPRQPEPGSVPPRKQQSQLTHRLQSLTRHPRRLDPSASSVSVSV
jgi:hypothetical protein